MTIKECHRILNINKDIKYNDEEVRQIYDYLYHLALLQLEAEKTIKNNELNILDYECNHILPCKQR